MKKETFRLSNPDIRIAINNSNHKRYVIDFDEVKTIEDIKLILKAQQMTIQTFNGVMPSEAATELLKKGILIETI